MVRVYYLFMALPAADTPADIPSTVCCDTVSLMADRIRTVALGGLCDCIEEACADREFRSYTTVGPRIEDPLGDALIAHLLSLGPTIGSSNNFGRLLPVAVHQARFEVRLLENGWPMIDTYDMTEQIVVPDSDMVNAITLHTMGHAERFYRALVDAIQRRELFLSSTNPHIGQIVLGNLEPVQPTSFIVGWRTELTVEVTL